MRLSILLTALVGSVRAGVGVLSTVGTSVAGSAESRVRRQGGHTAASGQEGNNECGRRPPSQPCAHDKAHEHRHQKRDVQTEPSDRYKGDLLFGGGLRLSSNKTWFSTFLLLSTRLAGRKSTLRLTRRPLSRIGASRKSIVNPVNPRPPSLIYQRIFKSTKTQSTLLRGHN